MSDPTALSGTPFTLKDSGQREDFATGSRRDTQDGKPRYDLVSRHALRREAELMAKGAVKYGERNWEKGQPFARTVASLLRHVYAYIDGDRSEDHLAAIRFNAGALVHFEEEIAAGRLPADLNDMDITQAATVPAAEGHTLGVGSKVRIIGPALGISDQASHIGTSGTILYAPDGKSFYVYPANWYYIAASLEAI